MGEMAPESGAGSETEPENSPEQGEETSQGEGGKPESGGSADDAPDPAKLTQQVEHWKAMARKNETRARENARKAAEFDKIEDANKTEIQRATEAQQRAEAERDAAVAQHNRVIAAATHELPVELIDHLGSGTDEEIMERAKMFSEVITKRATELADDIAEEKIRVAQASGGRNGAQGLSFARNARPVESMRAGAAPAGAGKQVSNDDIFRGMLTDQ
jgi:hypothetical protein